MAADTIVAAATPAGRGGVAIVRLSGVAVPAMLLPLLGERAAARASAAPRYALPAHFLDAAGEPLDAGLVVYFPAPHSYTGEAVLEMHAHGGPVLVEALIRRTVELGARRARAGEFTERAYLNGKLDLAQAEAVASLIDAASDAAARAALRSLEGEFSRQILELAEHIGSLRAWIEAAIDFPDEELDFLSVPQLAQRFSELAAALDDLQMTSRRGRVLTEGLTVVIAGRPNAGKSTLLNRLTGHEAAIVTPEPGTTRDVLRERIVLEGMPLTLLDTAGLRAASEDSADPIEREGMRRAREALQRADLILFVVDAVADPDGDAWQQERATLPSAVPVVILRNKCDLDAAAAARPPGDAGAAQAGAAQARDADVPSTLRISARTGEGIDQLVARLKAIAGLGDSEGSVLAARARHVEALARVAAHVDEARRQLAARRTAELVAEELRAAQRALGEILGEESNEALLGRIFSSFCIGK
ncbi:MAG TPA: tRNA uridine-5-carboxymethylaminomethyl(34) synthesis GTPase MnmE [Steroidobacteraceae bacterium]|nr:tRNA uridine-5-carboxymethylaminomethyl(34) synthesis GTPase MnmE [Steroidobacteraceae bacterium]